MRYTPSLDLAGTANDALEAALPKETPDAVAASLRVPILESVCGGDFGQVLRIGKHLTDPIGKHLAVEGSPVRQTVELSPFEAKFAASQPSVWKGIH